MTQWTKTQGKYPPESNRPPLSHLGAACVINAGWTNAHLSLWDTSSWGNVKGWKVGSSKMQEAFKECPHLLFWWGFLNTRCFLWEILAVTGNGLWHRHKAAHSGNGPGGTHTSLTHSFLLLYVCWIFGKGRCHKTVLGRSIHIKSKWDRITCFYTFISHLTFIVWPARDHLVAINAS